MGLWEAGWTGKLCRCVQMCAEIETGWGGCASLITVITAAFVISSVRRYDNVSGKKTPRNKLLFFIFLARNVNRLCGGCQLPITSLWECIPVTECLWDTLPILLTPPRPSGNLTRQQISVIECETVTAIDYQGNHIYGILFLTQYFPFLDEWLSDPIDFVWFRKE